jgi:Icc-related predicted phosphoesterase
MKTLILGDVHAEFGKLNEIINRKNPDLVICCGDFGKELIAYFSGWKCSDITCEYKQNWAHAIDVRGG